MANTLRSLILAELSGPVDAAVTRMGEAVGQRGRKPALGVLFYGSALRTGMRDGVLDFYVVVERLGDWHRSGIARLGNRLLPPNVEYHELVEEDRVMRAKVAILSLAQFRRLTGGGGLDASVWARFAQPVALVWSRDAAARHAVAACVATAVCTAARWAALLGPANGAALAFWQALFRCTYRSELRVEHSGRADELVEAAAARYAALLPLAWSESGIEFSLDGAGNYAPHLPSAARSRAATAWRWRRWLGHVLNALRLAKAAFTFNGGARYIAWKIRRHTGFDLGLTPWQERHPLLAAPGVLWRLRRHGLLR